MIRRVHQRPTVAAWAVVVGLATISAGCGQREVSAVVTVPNLVLGPMTVAVAPALNFSGSTDFDPVRAADLMASELGYVERIDVLPVSRVLAVLAEQGRTEIASPQHAREVVRRLGADAILVFAVTEYDPYHPPVMGISAQLYAAESVNRTAAIDPVRASRAATLPTVKGPTAAWRPIAQSQRVFDGSHGAIEEEVRRFAVARTGGVSGFGWRRFLWSQQDYLRFCCHATIRRLFGAGVETALVRDGER